MQVAALTSGKHLPSARFRVRQYIPHLRRRQIDVVDHCPPISQGAKLPGALGRIRERYLLPAAALKAVLNLAGRVPGIAGSRRADLTWLERHFIPGLDDLAGLLKPPLVLDIDDAIWLYNPLGKKMVRRLVRRAEMVLAGNRFIADWCSNHHQNIRIVPTGIDCGRFRPRLTPRPPGAPFVVGWTGTSANFVFLEMIVPALTMFLRAHRDAVLLVVADRRPRLAGLPAGQVVFVPWRAEIEHRVLHRMDVGIMPLDDSDISRGKCSFKMLQYLAAGLPVIASPYGMNREVLDLVPGGMGPKDAAQWRDCLQAAKADAEAGRFDPVALREIVLQNFAAEKIAGRIARAFFSVCGPKAPRG
ncbi:MAG: glycosyltransferase family 4 protein [Desulfobacteraceae bacterium]|jgi:glycosyltransferase involved in cell wall biosynthesis|nr:glycosyltransferase family 4 protein [Desulfobacteraceae bacterium]